MCLGTKSGTKFGRTSNRPRSIGPPRRQLSCALPEVGARVLQEASPLAAAMTAGITKTAMASATS